MDLTTERLVKTGYLKSYYHYCHEENILTLHHDLYIASNGGNLQVCGGSAWQLRFIFLDLILCTIIQIWQKTQVLQEQVNSINFRIYFNC
jgi:hypothetical protein